MSQRLTRAIFISPDVAKVAIAKETMYAVSEDGETIVEVPTLESIKASGVIPEGYAVDYHLDPATVVSSLASQNITTVEQLTEEVLERLKAEINDPQNVTIAPAYVVEEKREATEKALREMEAEAKSSKK